MIAAKYIIGGVALFGVAFGAFTVVRHYNSTIEENKQLEIELRLTQDQVKGLEELYTNVTTAQSTNDTNTRMIIERTQTIQEKINNVPVTTQCKDSPAIGVVLSDYDSRMRAEAASKPKSATTPAE